MNVPREVIFVDGGNGYIPTKLVSDCLFPITNKYIFKTSECRNPFIKIDGYISYFALISSTGIEDDEEIVFYYPENPKKSQEISVLYTTSKSEAKVATKWIHDHPGLVREKLIPLCREWYKQTEKQTEPTKKVKKK